MNFRYHTGKCLYTEIHSMFENFNHIIGLFSRHFMQRQGCKSTFKREGDHLAGWFISSEANTYAAGVMSDLHNW